MVQPEEIISEETVELCRVDGMSWYTVIFSSKYKHLIVAKKLSNHLRILKSGIHPWKAGTDGRTMGITLEAKTKKEAVRKTRERLKSIGWL